MNKHSDKFVTHTALFSFVVNVFTSLGFAVKDAQQAAHVLCEADLRGIDSHGVARLSGFVRLIEKGRINPKAQPKWLTDRLSAATLDADKGVGLVAARIAMEKAIEKAKNTGVAFVSVSNSNHFGIAAAHAELAVSEGMIGWAMTNASPLVAPWGSKERLFGTNPIAVAIPNPLSPESRPIILDMATSAAANGKLEIAARHNKPIPMGWAITKEGNPTNDPHVLKTGGALLPLGSDSEHGVHKGYGLGAVVDILSGVLSGANFGPWVPPFVSFLEPDPNLPGKGIGHFLGAMDISAFTDPDLFNRSIFQWYNRVKSAPTQTGNPLIIHGEPEFEYKKKRSETGIPLIEPVVLDLIQLADHLNIKTTLFD